MAEKSLGFWGTTLSGLAVLAVPAALAAFWPNNEFAIWIVRSMKAAWAGVVTVVSSIWQTANAPVPLWAFVVLGVLCAWLWTKRARPPSAPPLSKHHNALLELIAAADGQTVKHDIAAETLDLRRLIIDSLAEDLHRHGLLETVHGLGYVGLRLSGTGREHVLQHSLMGDLALVERLRKVQRSHSLDWMAR